MGEHLQPLIQQVIALSQQQQGQQSQSQDGYVPGGMPALAQTVLQQPGATSQIGGAPQMGASPQLNIGQLPNSPGAGSANIAQALGNIRF